MELARILPVTPSSTNTCHSIACGTVSNPILKSTKQQYRLPAFPDSLVYFCLSISDLSMDILSVVRKSFLKPACPLALTAWSSAHLLWHHCKQRSYHGTNCDDSVVAHVRFVTGLIYCNVIKPTDKRPGKCPAIMQLNSHSKLCFTSSPPGNDFAAVTQCTDAMK